MNEYNTPEEVYFHRPSLMNRVKSMVLDSVIIIVFMMLISKLLGILAIESGLVRGICLGLVILYEPIFVTLGGTLGQRMLGLRVISYSDYVEEKNRENINFLQSLIRYIVKILLGWISLLTIHSDNYGQAIHDKAGNSIMTFR